MGTQIIAFFVGLAVIFGVTLLLHFVIAPATGLVPLSMLIATSTGSFLGMMVATKICSANDASLSIVVPFIYGIMMLLAALRSRWPHSAWNMAWNLGQFAGLLVGAFVFMK